MEKVILIDGKEVKMASTVGTLYRYRMQFKSDFLKDLASLAEKLEQIKKSKEVGVYDEFNVMQLESFERIAWSMAKTADKNIPDIEDWLDEFDMFSIYEALPEILSLANTNFNDGNEKKNLIPKEVQKGY